MSITDEELETLRQLNATYYRNIFDIFPKNDRIYGTETLCGDWSGKILILAQDFSDVGCLNKRLQSNPDVNPFYHDPLNKTNVHLVELLSDNGVCVNINGGASSQSCGILYGSACWLIKEITGLGGALMGRREMIKASSGAFSITTKKLHNLQHIITLGKFAHTFLQLHFKIEAGRWRDLILERKYISVQNTELTIYPSAHTSQRGINNRLNGQNWDKKWSTVKEDWKYIFEAINS